MDPQKPEAPASTTPESTTPPPTPPANTTTPQPPSAPSAPAAEASAPAAADTANPPASSPVIPAPPAPKKKSKLPLVIGIVVGVVVLLAILFFVYILLFANILQANSTSNSFMHDMTTGDYKDAAALSGDTSNTAFLQHASESVSGSYHLQSSTNQNSKYYFLYTLTNSTNKYARTTVEKSNNGWAVTGFVYDSQPLKLIPSASTNNTSTSTTTTAPSSSSNPSTASATGCLGPNDFSALTPDPVQVDPSSGLYVWQDSFFFNANNTDYTYPDVMTQDFSAYAKFYQQNSSKQFTIKLSGEVNSTSPDDSLANARASKIQTDLETKSGIPASRIEIDPPTNYGTSLGAGDTGSANRNVAITVTSPDSCGTPTAP